jgi:predicted nucleic acid-binding protein
MLSETISNYVVIPFSREVCREWGAIRCERRTRTIAVDDAWIAATARTHGLRLVTHNPGDFSDIEGLDVLHES